MYLDSSFVRVEFNISINLIQFIIIIAYLLLLNALKGLQNPGQWNESALTDYRDKQSE